MTTDNFLKVVKSCSDSTLNSHYNFGGLAMLIWLEQARDSALVGAKAARLSVLAGQFPVPSGFCLTAAAFSQWLAQGQPETMPPNIAILLDRAYQEFAAKLNIAEPRVAVRSSAADEDSHSASSAGQYETYLNVVGISELREAVLRCWRSADTERVRAYRRRGSANSPQHSDDIRMGVLIQEQIAADISVIAFSVNPVSGNQTEGVINAVWGLGQSLADGSVTPDTYIFSKPALSLLRQDIGAKERMTILKLSGVQEVIVPRVMRRQPVLNADKLTQIAVMVCALEVLNGWHVDIECAFSGEKLYLLQCRPVTTLEK